MLLRVRVSLLLAGLGLVSLILLPPRSHASYPTPPLARSVHNHRWAAPVGNQPAGVPPIAAPAVCGVTGGTWTDRALYPTTLDGIAVVALGGVLYSFGGFDGTANVTAAYKYDPAANSWTAIAALPAARAGLSAVTDGSAIYLLNGYGAVGVTVAGVWRYTPGTNSYDTTLTAPTVDTGDQGAAYLGGQIYRIGGYSNSLGTDTATVEVYIVSSNSWTTTTAYPLAADGLATVVLNGAIYTAGGYDAGAGAATMKTYRYLPASPGWTDAAIADLPGVRAFAASGVLDGQFVVAGGDDLVTTFASATAWNPATDSWAALPPLAHTRDYTAGATIGSDFYVVGGDDAAQNPSRFNERYSITPCATATVTSTPGVSTATVTASRTAGATTSATASATTTATAILTATATASRTASATLTATAGATTTGTAIVMATATATASRTAGVSPTLTATTGATTATTTATPSRTATATAPVPTASTTATASASATSTIPVTATASSTAATPSRTATATAPVPTASATATASASATSTIPVTVTASSTAGLTATATPMPPTVTRTAAPSSTATLPPSNTATRTATVPVPSSTATTPPTGTATATVCAIRFSDVPYNDPTVYYSVPVYYLACHGIISGYSDGTFKPFNNTTRAQMTKIVTLAFNILLVTPVAGGTFADVDSTNVFYSLIETAAAHGIVSGYTCGGVNPQTGVAEPCTSGSRPYFRPSNFVTRGQLAKIVAIGAGWTLRSPATPTFADVPPSLVFYPFIETAACHGVISGYDDHTFRPANNATRGQIAKIAYLALNDSSGCLLAR
ncbi:MAG: S-layer homology domain-containing protein [Chloroflexota bacterium]|nr:S-layer homology domain-containing protein [Chloroflexota bacterium]